MNTLISIIVPVYNVAQYLDKCIQSIQNQSYSSLEIILVDDGSTDNSGVICDRYAASDNRIKVIHKQNGGLSDARNAGLDIATGEWVTFVDSDDYLAQDALLIMLLAATGNKCQIAVCNMIRIYEDGSTDDFYCPTNEVVLLKGDDRFDTLLQPSVCNKLFDMRLLYDVRFPKGKYYEDTFIYHILAHRATDIVLTGFDGYYYLSRKGSILGRPQYTDRYFDFIEAVYKRVNYLIDHNIEKSAKEACLSLYAAVSTAERYVKKNADNKYKFEQMWKWYQTAYEYLISKSDTGLKQKIRLILLKHFPGVHNKIY